jgi:hypothetical protein
MTQKEIIEDGFNHAAQNDQNLIGWLFLAICFLFLTTFLFICLWFYQGNKIKGLEYQLNQCKDVEAVYKANNECLTNANLKHNETN